VHGTTYGGNPLSCAVAGAVFDVIKHRRGARRRGKRGTRSSWRA
jgi:acetylornithine/succinyldiaminopimelate/putrescine aminotransferase